MHRLLVLYPAPKDPAHFRQYYVDTHLKLAEKLPGLRSSRYSFDVKGLGGDSPYFAVFEGEFDDEASLMAALQSDAGRAVGGDVKNYATGGATMVHYPVTRHTGS